MVYARCTKCKTRRDQASDKGVFCSDKSGHKRYVKWTANVQFMRNGPRYTASFDTEELALKQERQWHTDHDRGQLVTRKESIYRNASDVADEWYKMARAHNIIKATNKNEIYRVNLFKIAFKSRDIRTITYKDGIDHITKRRESGIAVGTINREMKPFRWIMNYAVKQGYIATNPFLEIKELKGANIHDRWMTVEEVHALISAAREMGDENLVDIIAVGVNTGFRKGNLERLTARDIQNNRIMAVETKSGDPYSVPIAPDIVPTLKRLVEQRPSGPLLRMSRVGPRFRAAARIAGLYRHKDDLQRVTIHTLRHTFAVLFLNRGGDIYDLSKLLGHSSVAITDKIYARFSKGRKDAQAPLMSTPIPKAKECPQAESNRSLLVENQPS